MEWAFRTEITRTHGNDSTLFSSSLGKDFDEALASTIKSLIKTGRPWHRFDSAKIYMMCPIMGDRIGTHPILVLDPQCIPRKGRKG